MNGKDQAMICGLPLMSLATCIVGKTGRIYHFESIEVGAFTQPRERRQHCAMRWGRGKMFNSSFLPSLEDYYSLSPGDVKRSPVTHNPPKYAACEEEKHLLPALERDF